MLIEMEVWESDGNNEEVRVGGFSFAKQHKERKVVDTDLFDWWSGVTFVEGNYGYPYPSQCHIPYKEQRGKYPLVVDRDTLAKVRETLGSGIVKI